MIAHLLPSAINGSHFFFMNSFKINTIKVIVFHTSNTGIVMRELMA
jgi:hypothetical protein